jgi:light-regulated signal transduction histidine kinase (bacteriophytochrome)
MPEETADQIQPVSRASMARFASDAAHELIGPIDQMSTLVALFVSRYCDPADEEAAAMLSHIQAAGMRMQAAAAGLRSYFRIVAATHRRESVDMNLALQTVMYLLAREIDESGASITAGDLPTVTGDVDLLTELLRILVENSLKFRRPAVAPEIHLSADFTEDACTYTLSDNGIGIDEKYREVVFIPFKKLNTCGVPSSGMGLAIAKAIMEIHHGSIEIEEPSDAGTSIVFAFPPVATVRQPRPR